MMNELEQVKETLENLVDQIGTIQYERRLYKDAMCHILKGMREDARGQVYLSLTPEGAECWKKAIDRLDSTGGR